MKKSLFRLKALSPVKAKTSTLPDDSVFKLGLSIPILSRFFLNSRISGREKAIKKLGNRIEKLVTAERQKVERVIDIARRTDIKSVYDRALALEGRLEEASCVKPKFSEEDEASDESPKAARHKKVDPLNIRCIHAISRGLFDNDQTTGRVSGKGSAQRFKRDELNVYLDKCIQGGGRVKITGPIVDSLTDGAKTTDIQVEIEDQEMSYKIPTREQHNRFIRNIWKWCIGGAVGIFTVVGGLMTILFLQGYDSKKIVEVSTTAFQVLVLSYGMGFFVPAFLTSLFNMALGVEMSRAGLEIGEQTAKILDQVDKAMLSRLHRLDGLFDRFDRMAVQADKGDHPLLAKLALDIQKAGDTIRDEVAELRKAFTRPIVPPPRRIEAPKGALAHVDSEKGNGA